MNLLACFKIVPDMEAIDSTDWEVDDSLSVDLSYVRPIWNCFDESSLEMLLKLSDLSEGFCSLVNLWALTAISVRCMHWGMRGRFGSRKKKKNCAFGRIGRRK